MSLNPWMYPVFSAVLLMMLAGCSRTEDDSDAPHSDSAPSANLVNEPEINVGIHNLPEDSEPKVEPMSASELFGSGREKMARGEYATAVQLLDQAVELSPARSDYLQFQADARFMNGEIEGAIAAYDRLIELEPGTAPRMWQRGLALYYANKFQQGKSQFETHQTVNSQDVENAVWHLLCTSRLEDLEQARKQLIPIERDLRIPMKEIYEMFAGRMTPDDVMRVASTSVVNSSEATYYANLYSGLYYEMTGEPERCEQHMRAAADDCPFESDVLMGQIAQIHLRLRNLEPQPIEKEE